MSPNYSCNSIFFAPVIIRIPAHWLWQHLPIAVLQKFFVLKKRTDPKKADESPNVSESDNHRRAPDGGIGAFQLSTPATEGWYIFCELESGNLMHLCRIHLQGAPTPALQATRMFVSALVLFAAASLSAGAKEVTFEWDTARSARAYVIEIKDANERMIFVQTVSAPGLALRLEEGDYFVRITQINKFGKAVSPGLWEPYSVKGNALPVLAATSTAVSSTMDAPGTPAKLVARADEEAPASVGPGRVLEEELMLPAWYPRTPDWGFRGGALLRSALLPGWGQAYQDRPVSAGIAGGAFGSVVLAGAVLYPAYTRERAAYEAESARVSTLFLFSPTVALLSMQNLSHRRHNLNARAANLNALSTAVLGIYLLNMADVTISELGRGESRVVARAQGDLLTAGVAVCLD